MVQQVKAVKVKNKSGFNGKETVYYQDVTLESGITVAVIDRKVMAPEVAVEILSMSDSTYTFTCICTEEKVEILFPAGLHFPQRRW